MAPASSTFLNKLKVQLKLSITRLRMVQQKDTALAKQQRRAMAQLLETGKTASARIRVENIIRSDLTTELLEILELYCELLAARAGLLDGPHAATTPAALVESGLDEAVRSIIFAAPRVDGVKELTLVRALLAERYGKDLTQSAMEGNGVSERVQAKLQVAPPPPQLVEDYLLVIAEAYGIDWPAGTKAKHDAALLADEAEEQNEVDDEDDDDDDERPGKMALSQATPPRRDLGGPRSPVSVMPPSPSTDNVRPKVLLPGAPPDLKPNQRMVDARKGVERSGGDGPPTTTTTTTTTTKKDGPGGKIPDVNELAARFAQLKR